MSDNECPTCHKPKSIIGWRDCVAEGCSWCHGHAAPPAAEPTCAKCGTAGKLYEQPAVRRWVHADKDHGRNHDFVTATPAAEPQTTIQMWDFEAYGRGPIKTDCGDFVLYADHATAIAEKDEQRLNERHALLDMIGERDAEIARLRGIIDMTNAAARHGGLR